MDFRSFVGNIIDFVFVAEPVGDALNEFVLVTSTRG